MAPGCQLSGRMGWFQSFQPFHWFQWGLEPFELLNA
jgi:hypothetical protein